MAGYMSAIVELLRPWLIDLGGWDPRPTVLVITLGIVAIWVERWWFKDYKPTLNPRPDPRYMKKALELVEASALAEIESLRQETFDSNGGTRAGAGADPEVASVDCGRPGCVRCTVYAAHAEAAAKRLAELAPVPSSRVVAGITNGPPSTTAAGGRDGAETEAASAAKTADARNPAQQPTVLLVPGLTCNAWVTEMHADTAVAALQAPSRHGKRKGPKAALQEVMLREWRELQETKGKHGLGKRGQNHTADAEAEAFAAAQRPQEEDAGRSSTERGSVWLRNDVEGCWEVLHFYNQGVKNEAAFELCPETAAIVDSIPGLMKECAFGNAYLSVLQPGTLIEPHCGPTNVRHRLHFALTAPDPRSVLTVDGMPQHWTVGECMIFDDSLEHSASHPDPASKPADQPAVADSSNGKRSQRSNNRAGRAVGSAIEEARVVLIVDLWHPELTTAERTAICHVYPPP